MRASTHASELIRRKPAALFGERMKGTNEDKALFYAGMHLLKCPQPVTPHRELRIQA